MRLAALQMFLMTGSREHGARRRSRRRRAHFVAEADRCAFARKIGLGLIAMPKFAANLSMMFNEWEFLDRFAAAADAGFRAVDFLFPYAWEPDDIAKRLASHGLTQALFNLPPGAWEAASSAASPRCLSVSAISRYSGRDGIALCGGDRRPGECGVMSGNAGFGQSQVRSFLRGFAALRRRRDRSERPRRRDRPDQSPGHAGVFLNGDFGYAAPN